MDIGMVANAASGGVLGLIGAGVGVVGKHFQAKVEARRLEGERAHELKLLEMQSKLHIEESEVEMEAEAQRGSWAGLQAGIEADAAEMSAAGLPSWVRGVRALWRPALTLMLLAATLMLWGDLLEMARGGDGALAALLSPAEAAGICRYIVYSVVFTASTSAMWWFADRALCPPHLKGR